MLALTVQPKSAPLLELVTIGLVTIRLASHDLVKYGARRVSVSKGGERV